MSDALLLLLASAPLLAAGPSQPLWDSSPPGETLRLPAGADPRGMVETIMA